MSIGEARLEELYDLLDDLCEGSLSPERAARLDGLLQSDPAMRQQYRRYLVVHVGLVLSADGREPAASPLSAGIAAEFPPTRAENLNPAQAADLPPKRRTGDPPPVPIAHSYLSRSHLGLSLSYVFAVLVIVAGVLAAWAWRAPGEPSVVWGDGSNVQTAAGDAAGAPMIATVTDGGRVAPNFTQHDAAGATMIAKVTDGGRVAPNFTQHDAAGATMIAKVTRTVGINNWRGPKAVTADARCDHCLGVMKGLVELTYSTGVKVTLEGPALFNVDSPNGGWLYHGKVTVSTPKAVDRPLFCLRCPTALVTEHGNNEFGLQVERSGASSIYVFRGNVEFQLPGPAGESRIIVLEPRDWLLAELCPNRIYRVNYMKGRKLPEAFIAQWFKGIAVASEEAKGGRTYRKDGLAPRKES
jgi:hypothetical protein